MWTRKSILAHVTHFLDSTRLEIFFRRGKLQNLYDFATIWNNVAMVNNKNGAMSRSNI